MKKIKRFAYAGAAILLSAGFAACSSEDEMAQEVAQRGAVKTEFNLNIPQKMATRMTDVTTQDGKPFRGMTGIQLLPFNDATVTSTSVRNAPNIEKVSNVDIATNGLDKVSNKAKLYKDVEVLIGTKGFLFYGYAIDQEASGTNVDNVDYTATEINGALTANAALTTQTNTPSAFEFTLSPIFSTGSTGKAETVVAYLNSIAQTEGWSASTNTGLKKLYNDFITLKAGSSRNVRAIVQKLYDLLKDNTDAVSTAIVANITSGTYVTLADNVISLKDNIAGYPADIHLPDGGAIIAWKDATTGFEVKTDVAHLGTTGKENVASLSSYAYPPSLYYTVNTPIYADRVSHETDYENETTWASLLAKYTANNTTTNKQEVEAETRSIALINEIQYGVGRLDLKVAATKANLEDNRSAIVGDDGKPQSNVNMTVGTTNFQVTGILIGGQYPSVDWEFLPKYNANTLTVYDKHFPTAAYMTQTTNPAVINRTLVLETPANENVKFAVEFLNNGDDFYGVDGWVMKGTKFYLIGEIDLSADNISKNKYVRDHHARKLNAGRTAFDTSDATFTTSDDIAQVFVQDYYTILQANVSSLQHAYNTVPDLRLPKLELGLSVNLTWQAANTYSVTLE